MPENPKRPHTLSHKIKLIERNVSDDFISISDLDSLTKETLDTVKIRDVLAHGMLHEWNDNEIKVSKYQASSITHHVEIMR